MTFMKVLYIVKEKEKDLKFRRFEEMTILFFTIEREKESAEVELLLLIMRLFTLASMKLLLHL